MPPDPTHDPNLSAIASWVLEEFAGGLASAVEAMAGARPDLTFQLLPSFAESANPVFRWSQPFAGIPGEASVLAEEADVLAIGQHVAAAAGIETASSDECKSTFREAVGQAFSVLTRALTARLQREVTSETGAEVPVTPADLAWGEVRLTLGDKPSTIRLGLPAQMLETLALEPKAQAVVASADSAPAAHPKEESKTFDLLLDVELPVSISFGHAQVPLKDVLKLTTGSIVELSRAVVEPVDIVVNNCIIAKGEVVVVEGNFGVRIQQVISRSERLRSLQ